MPKTTARPRRVTIAVVVLATLAACGVAPPLDDWLATVGSWRSTATFALAERRSGATSVAYTRQLHERAATALREARATADDAAHNPDERRRAHSALDSLAGAVDALGAASAP